MLAKEVDIRLYDATGKRMYLPQQWIDTVEFEIGERGGCQNGTLQAIARWEDLPLVGNEYVDIYLWGQRIYRGFVKTPQHEIGTPERVSPSLYGFMEILNGYLVRRCLCYAQPVDATQVFSDLMARYVRTPDRWPGITLDVNGGQPLGVTVQQFCAKDSTIPQALNALCDLAPNQMVWGCDVDVLKGVNRIYFRARPTQIGYRYAIGGAISGFVLPSDGTQVVNSVHLTGGTMDGTNGLPNLMPNAAFEECAIPGETTSNLLLNASFEDNNGDNSATFWNRGNDPTLAFGSGAARTGNAAFVMDNNPRTPETLSQIVAIPTITGLTGSFWYKTGGANQFQLSLNLLDANSNGLYSASGPAINATQDQVWHEYVLAYPNYPTDSRIAYAQIVLSLLSCADDSNGLVVDDFALWYPDVVIQSWGIGTNSNAQFSTLQWQCLDPTPKPVFGDNKVKVIPQINATGGYTEIQTTFDSRVEIKTTTPYVFRLNLQPNLSNAKVAIGVRTYKNASLQNTLVGNDYNLVGNLWQLLTYQFITGGDTTHVQPFVRFKTGGITYYVDASGLFVGSNAPTVYYPADKFEAQRTVQDYPLNMLTPDAYNSITLYGTREKNESQAAVIDSATLDQWMIGYFNAHAVPNVQGRLSLYAADAPVFLDGLIQIENLPTPRPALVPARARYEIGEAINIHIDLNNERPDMAQLLRNVIAGGE